jgi:hypothetical protein
MKNQAKAYSGGEDLFQQHEYRSLNMHFLVPIQAMFCLEWVNFLLKDD